MTDSPAGEYAVALLAEFVRAGVRDAVVCPGSRSQALALAAAALERAGLLRLHVRIDERSAGFLALGLAAESRTPVAIVTTSGTAVANLHPAVLEASHAGIPLLLLTGDRPEELRGIGANQATIQDGIFGSAVRRAWDVPPAGSAEGAAALAREAVAATTLRGGGPVHLNLAFREPLSGDIRLPEIEPGRWSPAPPSSDVVTLRPGPGIVVVAGSGAGERAEEVARELGAPLLAEVASGARFGPNLVAAYRELLDTGNFGDRVERVVVFGHPTLSREVPALIQRPGVETLVVRTPGRDDYAPGRAVRRFADAVVVEPDGAGLEASRSWVGRWVAASRRILDEAAAADEPLGAVLTDDAVARARWAREQVAQLREPVSRRLLVRAVWDATWPHDRLVLGASRLIRELDRLAPGKRVRAHANRGLGGIDGTIATASGIALASADRGTTRLLLGDLALLHDAGSLLGSGGAEGEGGRIQVVVGDDHGGSIFDTLEVASADPELYGRVMRTPQDVDVEALAAAYGWEFRRVEHRGDLTPALTDAGAARTLVHVPLAR
ncbi:2-succinyl-5-enolpyruvyl-6-hydroxy-3-cyclohexene-1-carboxylic-acid synthase [Pseudolysinimonas sp.]|uniref:2-succinyl-5-enolpyruvyl-6-hydroxy-3- cyclohexene-1-carboxylic-acid synthase n=1 Tax=Pseudolysinimonas sp. TaxID=2680009 RepID=UPI003F7EF07A